MMSGIGSEVGGLEELLDAMLKTEKDHQGSKDDENVMLAAVESRNE